MAEPDEATIAGLIRRDRNLIKFCRETGMLGLFEKVLRQVDRSPPDDVYAHFVAFVVGMRYVDPPTCAKRKIETKFGFDVKYMYFQHVVIPIVLVVRGNTPFHFVSAEELELVPKTPPKLAPRPAILGTRLGDVPRESTFYAALRSQTPSRGRSTPDAPIGKPRGR